MNRMSVFIIGTSFGFPNGTGAAARVRAYATGLFATGVQVEVLCLKPTEPHEGQALNPDERGVFNGIPFSYTCGTSRSSGRRLRNAMLFLKGSWVAATRIRRAAPRRKSVMLAFTGDDPLSLLSLIMISRWCKASIVNERSEFPMVNYPDGLRKRVVGWINDTWLYPQMNGMIVISTLLERHFHKLLGIEFPVARVPILADTQHFSRIAEGRSVSQSKTITYCGNLDQPGEVETLIEAFRAATTDQQDWKLQIIGGSNNRSRSEAIKDLAAAKGISSRVFLVGTMSHDRIPGLLLASAILALPRASGTFSSAGFPTKLGEYLATGRPVVVTATGDIPMYLKDGESAYLAPPNDTNAFARRLRYIMDHPQEAETVGLQGRKVAEESFDARAECGRLLSWLNQRILIGSHGIKSDDR